MKQEGPAHLHAPAPSLLPEAKFGDFGSFCSKIVVMRGKEWYTVPTAYTICGN